MVFTSGQSIQICKNKLISVEISLRASYLGYHHQRAGMHMCLCLSAGYPLLLYSGGVRSGPEVAPHFPQFEAESPHLMPSGC